MIMAAKIAPTVLAITSKTSAFLVSVNMFCITSIAIPKTKDNKTEKTNGL